MAVSGITSTQVQHSYVYFFNHIPQALRFFLSNNHVILLHFPEIVYNKTKLNFWLSGYGNIRYLFNIHQVNSSPQYSGADYDGINSS